MNWSERINTASSGSGQVDDIKGHLQGEIRRPTKLVKMPGGDAMRWTGSPKGRECGMQSSQPSRWESSEIDGQAERPKWAGANESIILCRGL